MGETANLFRKVFPGLSGNPSWCSYDHFFHLVLHIVHVLLIVALLKCEIRDLFLG